MANINESGYFLSNAVRVYPCAYRGNNIDPAAKYTTEHNITNAPVGLKHKNSYIVEASSTGDTIKVIKVVIGGYYFELTLGEGDSLANKKLVIEPKTIGGQEYLGAVLTNIDDDESLTLDDIDADGNSYFYGLKVEGVEDIEADGALEPTSTSLVVFIENTENGEIEINQFAVLPEITHGEAEGETILQSATITGAASIGGTLAVAGETTLTGKATLGEGLEVTGNTILQGELAVSNISNLNGGIAVDTNKFKVDTDGNTTVAGTLTVDGISNLKGRIAVNIDGTDKFAVDTDGDADVAGTLTVGGKATLEGGLDVTEGNATILSGTLTVNGGSVSAESADVTVKSLTTTAGGNITCNGNITCSGNLTVTGQTTLNDEIKINTVTETEPISLKNYLLDLIYPIGSIYMTMGDTTPGNLLGGT